MSTTAAEMSWDDIKALVAELAIQSKETDRKMREVFERFDNLSRRFGDLGNRLDEFVEAMVEPALVDLFRARGLSARSIA
jgi:methyl-accepting chemotaxis protein